MKNEKFSRFALFLNQKSTHGLLIRALKVRLNFQFKTEIGKGHFCRF